MKYILIFILLILSSCVTMKDESGFSEGELPSVEEFNEMHQGVFDEEDAILEMNEVTEAILETEVETEVEAGEVIFIETEEEHNKMMSSQGQNSVEADLPVEAEELLLESDMSAMTIAPPIADTKGLMTHNIPKEMKVGEVYPVKLRITRSNNREIIDFEINHKVHRIKTSAIMEVILSDPTPGDNKVFEIKTITKEKQIVSEATDETFTEWEWTVRPIKSGNNKLSLIVYVHEETELGRGTKSTPVFNDAIIVESNITWTVWRFIETYWQWLAGSIVIPLIVFLWKRRKDKEEQS